MDNLMKAVSMKSGSPESNQFIYDIARAHAEEALRGSGGASQPGGDVVPEFSQATPEGLGISPQQPRGSLVEPKQRNVSHAAPHKYNRDDFAADMREMQGFKEQNNPYSTEDPRLVSHRTGQPLNNRSVQSESTEGQPMMYGERHRGTVPQTGSMWNGRPMPTSRSPEGRPTGDGGEVDEGGHSTGRKDFHEGFPGSLTYRQKEFDAKHANDGRAINPKYAHGLGQSQYNYGPNDNSGANTAGANGKPEDYYADQARSKKGYLLSDVGANGQHVEGQVGLYNSDGGLVKKVQNGYTPNRVSQSAAEEKYRKSPEGLEAAAMLHLADRAKFYNDAGAAKMLSDMIHNRRTSEDTRYGHDKSFAGTIYTADSAERTGISNNATSENNNKRTNATLEKTTDMNNIAKSKDVDTEWKGRLNERGLANEGLLEQAHVTGKYHVEAANAQAAAQERRDAQRAQARLEAATATMNQREKQTANSVHMGLMNMFAKEKKQAAAAKAMIYIQNHPDVKANPGILLDANKYEGLIRKKMANAAAARDHWFHTDSDADYDDVIEDIE
jgi:hypothetical protein